MKTLIVLTALVALATAFDFPKDWELWKRVRGKKFIAPYFFFSKAGKFVRQNVCLAPCFRFNDLC